MRQDSLKFKLLLIYITAIGLFSLLFIIFFTSPYQDNNIVMINEKSQVNFFTVMGAYISLWLLFMGMFSMLFFKFNHRKISSKGLYLSAITSLRQGFLIGCLTCVLLFLQSLHILIWWDALLVIFAIILIEMYIMANNKLE